MMTKTFHKFYGKHSNPRIVMDIIDDCLGFTISKNGTKILWIKTVTLFLFQVTSFIRFIFFWLYWDTDPDILSIMIKYWSVPKYTMVPFFWILLSYAMSSRAYCLLNVVQRNHNFNLIMLPFKIICDINDTTDHHGHRYRILCTDSYKVFITGKINAIIFLIELWRKTFIFILIQAYCIGPVREKSWTHLLFRFLWSIHLSVAMDHTFKQIMCVMLIIYVNCLTVYFILKSDENDLRTIYLNLATGLTWLVHSNKPLRVLIGLFVSCTWASSLLVMFNLTLHKPPMFIQIGGTIGLIEISGCLILILYTVSFVSHKIQQIIHHQLCKLPQVKGISVVTRMKYNNILALSMVKNSFSYFDFFDIQRQFIFAAILALTKYYILLFRKIDDNSAQINDW